MIHSASRKPLMVKLGLQIDQLDYKYIETCCDSKQLEKILQVLESGEEGIYPDLTRFCKSRLKEVSPNSKFVQPLVKISSYADLSKEESDRIQKDMQNWCDTFSQQETNKLHGVISATTDNLPPIRKKTVLSKEGSNAEKLTLGQNSSTLKRCKPRSFKDWDKFNVEEELKKLDEEKPESLHEKEEARKHLDLDTKIPISGLSERECEHIANLEKTKGNEAFKAREYEEAVLYYTRSLSVFKMASTFNNRAQAYIKLANYPAAIFDCNEVINLEPNNIKALYRRGLAYKEGEIYDLAKLNFKLILMIDPTNKSAKDQLEEIKKLQLQKRPEEQRAMIEEIESTLADEESSKESNITTKQESSTRLAIQEIVSNSQHQQTLDEICGNYKAEDDIPSLSQKAREILSIFPQKKDKTDSTNSLNSKRTCSKKNDIEEMGHSFTYIITEDCIENTRKKLEENSSKKTNSKSPVEAEQPQKECMDIRIESNSSPKNENSSVSEKQDFSVPGNKTNLKNKKNYIMLEGIKTRETKAIKQIWNKNEMKANDSESIYKETVSQNYANNEKVKLEFTSPTHSNFLKLKPIERNTIKFRTKKKVTPFEFLQIWYSSNANSDSNIGAQCLSLVKPEEFPTMVTNKIDGYMLNGLLKAICNIITTGESEDGIKYLQFLTKIPRISTVAMFLSAEEKKGINTLFSIMENEHGVDMISIKRILMI
ncbi:RNA polymerase II-associated protein 3-like isoform X2 [Stegodyphus dumicola]|uniref:RNA polymerase II-associated protein 3-like isoform X2 n=1 Tax=Stegodyphus dumicola TaxID=202533 RepID=UPI0015B32AC4|nr:RNA polymerase II-associated protein 3-like isoform X2 [Stegodyphus dumicola]